MTELSKLTTEKRNKNSMKLDQMSTIDILKTINQEDKKVADAVEQVLPQVEKATDQIYQSFKNGGRLFYIGAGTSGRLGFMDASECPPTFMAPPEMIQTIMAGGGGAVKSAVENAEDDEEQGRLDLEAKQLTKDDVVIGITASGRTPYPIGGLKCAREVGAYTVSLSCNHDSLISQYADCEIEVVVGPEVLTGSTRLKAGTAHKMVLNMISTTAMVKLGKVYENLMVDVHASNYKLLERAKSIIMDITKVPYEKASKALFAANKEVKPAIVMLEANVSLETAKEAIQQANGYVRQAIEIAEQHSN
ncbi:N-acetylmuramic acid 6-phosphate etherase [Salinibacillus xinjiangensis]|uniref:N-acetylmuramic acid 6-phosphate etherase n=1 Tax=Salinibacillus xinjiangensis TaxID=1229268 RepID=A0A6G1X1W6_9BACI|nr:N-acetylmuramic acid 6-phosphate etherase [Salinibacillus xinjiangensis]MRG84932.1 N-acetylmuramic acid 6-phosphate etherase [Salinibacillus xinjiangensis]